MLRSQYQGLEGKRDRSNYDYSKLKKKEEEENSIIIVGFSDLILAILLW